MEHMNLSCIIPIGPNHRNNKNLIESIKADSGSTKFILVFDSTPTEIKRELIEFSEKNASITTIEINANNPGGARNAGMKECNTTWVVFFDADDLFNTQVIANYLKQSSTSADAIVFNYLIQDASQAVMGKVKEDSRGKIDAFNRKQIARNPGIWRWVFKFENIKSSRFRELRMGEDIVFLIDFLLVNRQINFSSEVVYMYNKDNSMQLTRSHDAKQNLLAAFVSSLQSLSRNAKALPNIDLRVDLTSALMYSCIIHLKWRSRQEALQALLLFAMKSSRNLHLAYKIITSRLRIKSEG